MNTTLFEIGEDIRALAELLEDVDGELIDGASEEAIDRWFKENQTNLADKLEGYCWLIKEKDHLAKIRKEEERRINALRKTDERTVNRLKERLRLFFKSADIQKTETRSFKLWVQRNSAPSLSVTDELDPTLLPSRYQKIVVVMDRAAIGLDAEELYNLEQVCTGDGLHPGSPEEIAVQERIRLLREQLAGIAHMNPPGEHLRIK